MQPVTLNGGFAHIMDAMAATSTRLSVSMQRLSTGVRVNLAQDDPAASAVSTSWKAQQGGLTEAIRNIQQAQDMITVAQDGLNSITEALQRIRSLAVRAADASLNDSDRSSVQNEIDHLVKEIDHRAKSTVYNRRTLLDGTFAPSQPDPTTITTPANEQLASGKSLLDTVKAPSVVGKYNSQSYKFVVVNNATGGVDAQVYNSRSSDPNNPVTRILNLQNGAQSLTLGPSEVTKLTTGANPSDIAVDTNTKTGYVTNYGDGTVSVVHVDENGAANQTTGTVHMGANSHPIQVKLTDQYALVLNQGDGTSASTLAFVRRTDNTVVKTLSMGIRADGLAVDGSGTRAAVANAGDGTVTVVDIANQAVQHVVGIGNPVDGVLNTPNSVAFTPDGNTVLVTNQFAGKVTKINMSNYATGDIQLQGMLPTGIAITPDGGKAIVGGVYANTNLDAGNKVGIIDLASNQVSYVDLTGTGATSPNQITVDPKGRWAYFTNGGANGKSGGAIDLTNNTFKALTQTDSNAMGGAFFANGAWLASAVFSGNSSRTARSSDATVVTATGGADAAMGSTDVMVTQQGTYSKTQSTAAVQGFYGLLTANSVATAGFGLTPDNGGIISVSNTAGTKNLAWNNQQTVDTVLANLNSNTLGITASYDATRNLLTLNSSNGNLTLKEVTRTAGGTGFFAANHIAAPAVGMTYGAIVSSSQFVTHGIDQTASMANAGFALAPDTAGHIQITNNLGGNQTFAWTSATSVGNLIGQINAANLGISLAYDATSNKLTVTKGGTIGSYTLAEVTDHGAPGFFQVNGISAAPVGTTYSASTSSNLDVLPGIHRAQPLNLGGYGLTLDPVGTIMISDGTQVQSIDYNAGTTTTDQLLSQINTKFGAGTAAYDSTNNRLTISNPNFTLYEVTGAGGPGFFTANHVGATTTGTSETAAGTTSTAVVDKGIVSSVALNGAGYALSLDTSGTIMVNNGLNARGYDWNSATTTTDQLVNAINTDFGAGTAAYDAAGHHLTISSPNFTLFEVTATGGNGFLKANDIAAASSGGNAVASSQTSVTVVHAGIDPTNSLTTAGFQLPIDTGGVIVMSDGTKSRSFHYVSGTTTVNDLTQAINTQFGANTAKYDATRNVLTISNPNFTLYEVTNNGGNGFLGVNGLPVSTTGTNVAGGTTSTSDVQKGLVLSSPLQTAGYQLPLDSGGTLMVADGTHALGIHWDPTSSTPQTVVDAINTTFGAGTAAYDAGHSRLTISRPNFTLYEVTDTGGSGFFAANGINATSSGTNLTAAGTTSTAIVDKGVDTTAALQNAHYAATLDNQGVMVVSNGSTVKGYAWNKGTTTVNSLLTSINTDFGAGTVAYDSGKNLLTVTQPNFTLYEVTGSGGTGFVGANNIVATTSGTAVASSAASSGVVHVGVNPANSIGTAGYQLTPDSGGVLVMANGSQAHAFQWNATTTTPGQLIGQINTAFGAGTAAYDATNNLLTVSNPSFKLYEITNTGGTGFLGVNDILATTTGTSVAVSTASTADVHPGINLASSLSTAGYQLSLDSGGTVMVGNGTVTRGYDYTSSTTTTQQLVDAINNDFGPGTASYDANHDRLTISQPHFTLFEVTNTGGTGFLAANQIAAPTTGTGFTAAGATSSADVNGGVRMTQPLQSAGYVNPTDPTGVLMIQSGSTVKGYAWNKATTTTQQLINSINTDFGAGTAAYDPTGNLLTITKPNFTVYEVTSNGGPGFLGANQINAATSGSAVAGSASSPNIVHAGLTTANAVATAGYELNPDSGGAFIVADGAKAMSYTWQGGVTTVDSLLNAVNADFGAGTAAYDPSKNALTLTRPNFTLYDISNNVGANGFLTVNKIGAAATGTSVAASTASTTDVHRGVALANTLSTAGYELSLDASGTVMISDGAQVHGFNWNSATSTVNSLVGAINTQFGAGTAAYDASNNRLTISRPNFQLFELTSDAGIGFTTANHINASTTGTAYAPAGTSSTQDVNIGLNQANPLGTAGYAIGLDTSGVFMVSDGTTVKGYSWNRTTTTVSSLLNAINADYGAGTAAYDVAGDKLTITHPNFTLYEVTGNGGPGFIASNQINVATTGTNVATTAASSGIAHAGINTASTIGTAGYELAPDTGGSFIVADGARARAYAWTPGATTVASLLGQINTDFGGGTAAYDPTSNQLTLSRPNLSLYEVTNTGGTGFLGVNKISATTTGTNIAVGASSSNDIHTGVNVGNSLATAGYQLPVDSGGVFMVSDGTTARGYAYNSAVTTVGSLLNSINTDFGAGTAAYDATNNRLTFSRPNFTLYDVTNTGGNGLMAVNDITVNTTGQAEAAAGTSSTGNVAHGLLIANPVATAGYTLPIDASGAFIISDGTNVHGYNYQSGTTSVSTLLNAINTDFGAGTAQYDGAAKRLTITHPNFTVYELSSANTNGFFKVNNIAETTAGTSVAASTGSTSDVHSGLTTSAVLNSAGFDTSLDTGGVFIIADGTNARGFSWNPTTNTVDSLVNSINTTYGAGSAAYDATKNRLTLTRPNLTLYEVTNTGGTGFLGAFKINAAATGTSVAAGTASTATVHTGIVSSNSLSTGGYELGLDSGGTVVVQAGGVVKGYNWTAGTTTSDSLVGSINADFGAGVASYDATKNKLTITDPNFTLYEVANNNGTGYFAANKINAATAGTGYGPGGASSTQDVDNGVTAANTLATAGYTLPIDTGGSIIVSNGTTIKAYTWQSATTTVNQLLNSINTDFGAGTAQYDLSNNKLTFTQPNFTLYEVTNSGGNGFLGVNDIAATTSGTAVAGSSASTADVHKGLILGNTLNTAGFDTSLDTGGVFVIADGSQARAYQWNPNATTVNSLLGAVNADFGAGTAAYDATANRLTLTRPSFTLYSVTNTGGAGFLAANKINSTTTGTSVTSSTTSNQDVNAGVTLSSAIGTAGFAQTADAGGSFIMSDGTKTVSMTWSAATTTVQNVVDTINTKFGAGTAAYDPTNNILTVSRPNFTLREITDNNGPGFFQINNIQLSQQGQGYGSSATSSGFLEAGINLAAPLSGAGYEQTLAAQGHLTITSNGHTAEQWWQGNGTGVSGFTVSSGGTGPQSVASDTSGNVWVTNTTNKTIAKFDSNGNQLFTHVDAQNVIGVAVDSSGNAYVINSGNDTIEKFDANGNLLANLNPGGGGHSRDIAIGPAGNIWTTDDAGRVARITPSGTLLASFNTIGKAWGISIDSGSNAWVSSNDKNQMQKFDSNGNLLLTVNTGAGPTWVKTDSLGNAWVLNSTANTVQKFDTNGNLLGTFNVTGSGAGKLAVDASNNVWVTTGSDVTELNNSGAAVNTYALTGGTDGMAFSPTGNLWVTRNTTSQLTKLDLNAPVGNSVSALLTSLNDPTRNLDLKFAYNADANQLAISRTNGYAGNYTIGETTVGGGVGFMAANEIAPGTFSATAASSVAITAGLNPNNSLAAAGYALTPDTSGTITVTHGGTFNFSWTAATTTVQQVLNFLTTTAGLTASFDAHKDVLTIGGGPFTLAENTANGGNGFFAINGINATGTSGGTTYAAATTSPSFEEAGLTTANALGTAGYDQTLASGGGHLTLTSNTGSTIGEQWWRPNGTGLSGFTKTAAGTTQEGVAVDGLSNAWVANQGSNSVSKYDTNGNLLVTTAIGAQATSVAVDANNNVWVARVNDNKITELNSAGTVVGTFTPSGGGHNHDVAVDASGNVWTATDARFLSKLNSSGTQTGSFNTNGKAWGVAVDGTGNVWVTSNDTNRLQKFSNAGALLGTFNTGNAPTWVKTDTSGNVWVINSADNTVQKFDNNGNSLGTFGVAGAGSGRLAVDASNNVWITTGTVGNAVTELASNGSPVNNWLIGGNSQGVAFGPTGNMWVTRANSAQLTKVITSAPVANSVDAMLTSMNDPTRGLNLNFAYNATKNDLTISRTNGYSGSYTIAESFAGAGVAWTDANYIAPGTYSASVSSSNAVTNGINLTASIATAGFALPADSGGSIVIKKGTGTFNFDWSASTTTVQNFLDFLNNTAGLTASYDFHHDKLTVSGGPFTVDEVTNTGGNGLFALNGISAAGGGTAFAGSVSSSNSVTPGLDPTQTLAAARFGLSMDSGGIIVLNHNNATAKLRYDSATTTVQQVLNFFTGQGLTASYDAGNHHLTIGGGPYTVYEVTDHGGNGFLTANRITNATTGQSYTTNTTSTAAAAAGVNTSSTLGTASFSGTAATSGSIVIKRSGSTFSMNWNKNTSTVQDVLTFLNGTAGLTASYDTHKDRLTVAGGPFTMYEVTSGDGSGFFALNNISAATSGSSYTGSVTSSQDVTNGLALTNPLGSNDFASSLDTAGTIMVQRNGVAQSFNWNKASTTVQQVLTFLTGQGLTASYDSGNHRLTVAGNGQAFNLYEVTANGGNGFFAANHISVATSGHAYTTSVASSAAIAPGLNLASTIATAGYNQTADTGGTIVIHKGAVTSQFRWTKAANTTQDVINFINGTGLTATYDAHKDTLNVSGGPFTMYEVTDTGGPGFFNLNKVTINTTGQAYVGGTTTSTAAAAAGLNLTQSLATEAYRGTVATSGTIMVQKGTTVSSFNWNKNANTSQDVVNFLNGLGLTAAYDAHHDRLTVSGGPFTLAEVNSSDGQGFFALNGITATVTGTSYAGSVTSSADVTNGVALNASLGGNSFFLTPDTTGTITVKRGAATANLNWNRNTTTVQNVLDFLNLQAGLTASYDATHQILSVGGNGQAFNLYEVTATGGNGFFKINNINVGTTGTTYVGSVSSATSVAPGLNTAAAIGTANYGKPSDSGGSIVVHKGSNTYQLNWNAGTTTTQNVVNFLNASGVTASYDAHGDRLNITGGPYSLYEVTNTGGNGFFSLNGIAVTTSGQSYAGGATSAAAVAPGIQAANTLATANFAGTMATQGTLTVQRNGVVSDFNWNRNATTVQQVLNFLNGTGMTAAYDAHHDRLTVSNGPFTLYEVNSNDGQGFFAANKIAVTTTGSTYAGSVTSSQSVTGGITLANTLANNPYAQTFDSSGTIMVKRGSTAQSFDWNKNTTTVQNVLDFLNSTGLTASYDAGDHRLTVNGNGTAFTLLEKTATGGNGFFAVNNIAAGGTGVTYVGSATSNQAVAPGINAGQTISTASFNGAADTGGTIVVRKGTSTFNMNWTAGTTTIQSVLTFLNGAGLTASYDAHGDKLTVGGGPYTLYEVTNHGGQGFFALNGVTVATTGQSYTGSAVSSAAVAPGINLAQTIGSAGFNGTAANSGTITVKKGTTVVDLNWTRGATTVQNVLDFLNNQAGLTAAYDAHHDKLTVSGGPYTLFEVTNGSGSGFFGLNGITASASGTSYAGSATSSQEVTGGISPTNTIATAGWGATPDSGGTITIDRGGQAHSFNWTAATTSVQNVLDFLNNTAGLSATYDAGHHHLTVTGNGSPFTAYEATATGGNGFFKLNNIAVSTTGTSFAGSVTSSQSAAPGVNPNQTMAAANLTVAPDTGGSIVINKGGQSYSMNWNAATTRLQDVLNFLNGAGVTASYDAHGDRLDLTGGPFSMYEVTNHGGPGFFAVNNVSVATNGQAYTGSTASTQSVAAGINTASTLAVATFLTPIATEGTIMVHAGSNAAEFNYQKSTTTVQDVLNFLNANGVSASYDAHHDRLTLSGGPFTLYEVNSHDGAGFFAANNIAVATTGTSYAGSVTSSSEVAAPEILLNQTIAGNGFLQTPDSGGTITVQRASHSYNLNWNATTTTVGDVLGFLNNAGLQASYDASTDHLTVSGNGQPFTLYELTNNGGNGFFKLNNIQVTQTGAAYTGSVTSSQSVTAGVDPTRPIASANFAATPDSGGSIVIHKGSNTYNLDWDKNLTTVQNVLNFLNTTVGLNATYDASHSALTISGGPFTMYEVTNSPTGNGFFALNHIAVNTTGSSFTNSISSSQAIAQGINTGATLASAGFIGTAATDGTLAVKVGNNTTSFNWNKNTTTVQAVLNFLNANGVTAAYNAHDDKLTVSGGPYTLYETHSGDGQGFFGLNGIQADVSGTPYTGSVTSSTNVTGGVKLGQTLAANRFITAPDTSGSIAVQINGNVKSLNWTASTTTVQNVLDFLNGLGLNAAYDAEHSKLSVSGNGHPFKLFEVTANGGPGFFAINDVAVSTTGAHYTGSVTSSGAASAPPGIVASKAINSNNFALTPDASGGTIVLSTSNGYNKSFKWAATDTVGSLLTKLNADSATDGVSFAYNTDNSRLVVTKTPSLGSYTLAEVTDSGGTGFLNINKLGVTTTGTSYTTSVASNAPVTNGIDLNGTISTTNNFALAPDTGGVIHVTTAGDPIGKSFTWDNTTKVGDLLNQINGAGLGINVSYDTSKHTLSVDPGLNASVTLAEVTNNNGNGFFAINKIDASTTGTTYGNTVTSPSPVTTNTDAILADPSKPITRYAYETTPGNPNTLQEIQAGDVQINGVTLNIKATDTLQNVIDKINGAAGDPGGQGTHVVAYFEDTNGPAAGGGKFYLKSTAWGEAIHLGDSGNTHFWDAMHVADDTSGQVLKFTRNGIADTTGVAANLKAYVNPDDNFKVQATISPGTTVTFAANDNFNYGANYFVGPQAAAAGLYSGPLNKHSLVTVDPGSATGSGLRILNNGFINYTINQASTEDVGKVGMIKVVDPMLVTTDNSLQFQVGEGEGEIQRLGIANSNSLALFGPNYHPTVSTAFQAEDLIAQTDAALTAVSTTNLNVGQFAQNIGRTLDLQRATSTSLQNSISLLTDTDMTQEATSLTKQQILAQSGLAMQSQANINERLVLELIRAGG